MRQKPALPPWIVYFNVAPPPQTRAAYFYLEAKTPRGSGQVATRCTHIDCADGDSDGHLIGVDVVMAAAERRAWAHSATHQPPDKES